MPSSAIHSSFVTHWSPPPDSKSDEHDDHVGEHRERAGEHRRAPETRRQQRRDEAARQRQEQHDGQVDGHELLMRK